MTKHPTSRAERLKIKKKKSEYKIPRNEETTLFKRVKQIQEAGDDYEEYRDLPWKHRRRNRTTAEKYGDIDG